MTSKLHELSDLICDSARAQLATDRVNFIRIGEDAHGQRIDNFLMRLARDVPKTHVYRIIRGGEVRVNKARVKAETKLAVGDIVRVPPIRTRKKESNTAPVLPKHALKILYEDRHLLVVDKPAGLASHGGSGVAHGLIERLRATRPEEPMLELAHRLDRETSGVLIVAKTRKALVRLHDMMKEGSIEKHYRTLVKGDWVNDRQHVRFPLTRFLLPSGERRVKVDPVEGAPAHSIFTLLARYGTVSFLDVELKTGRTHQIRVHALGSGYPLVGDDKYGDYEFNKACVHGLLGVPLKRMFLHAWRLRFNHPVTGEALDIQAPLPEELAQVIRHLNAQAGITLADAPDLTDPD